MKRVKNEITVQIFVTTTLRIGFIPNSTAQTEARVPGGIMNEINNTNLKIC